MKRISLLTHTLLAIILIMVVSMLPHHHHHGQHCWAVDVTTEHCHDSDTPHPDDCPADSCNDNACYLQSMTTYMQAERPVTDNTANMVALLPDFWNCAPCFIYISQYKPEKSSVGLTSSDVQTLLLRGPPTA